MKLKEDREAMPANQRRRPNWGMGIFLGATHVAAIAALFFWSWPAVITAVVFYWVAGSLGIGMGYHRLLTHRGYKVPKIVEYFLVTCGTMTLEGEVEWNYQKQRAEEIVRRVKGVRGVINTITVKLSA